MTDMLLSLSTDMTLSQDQAAYVYKDQPDTMESASFLGGIIACIMRVQATKDGEIANLEVVCM